ncbi:hypothetical protein MKZ38_010086 [Zalerion maritima]|uniref:Uncharacterized protein n=1 Tax=Zalerion maritima TaxID=339359 RepID=A0AAD5WUD9_9PEZI|nr:hypothetical protein MKZ38_010086 [Zalerion maritima]
MNTAPDDKLNFYISPYVDTNTNDNNPAAKGNQCASAAASGAPHHVHPEQQQDDGSAAAPAVPSTNTVAPSPAADAQTLVGRDVELRHLLIFLSTALPPATPSRNRSPRAPPAPILLALRSSQRN